MKLAIFALIVSIVVIVSSSPQKYTTKYDNIDLDQILTSDRLLKNYVNCLLDKGKCSPDGQELKRNLAEALQNDCAKCSEKQRTGSRKVIRFLIDNKEDWWKELEAKYDPDGTYKAKYEEEKNA